MASSIFHRMLRVKLAEVLEARASELTSGLCKDYAAYREEVGYIRGLKDALVYSEEVEREPDERSNTG